MKNARLIIAIITSLLDEAIIVALIIWGLPKLGVQLPLWVIIIILLAFAAYAVITFRLGSRILRKTPMPGFTSMIGVQGRVVKRLAPVGFVRIQGELWESRSQTGNIEIGSDVVVVAQSGLKLIVSRKQDVLAPQSYTPIK
jgi:membrane-bound ClpP family serine protease